MVMISLFSRLSLFHHFTKTWGSFYHVNINRTLYYIQGLGKSTTLKVTPDIDVLFYEPVAWPSAVPTLTTILEIPSEVDVETLAPSATTYNPINFIPIPNFFFLPISYSIIKNKWNAIHILLDVIILVK